jgi:hypothetical protein
MFLAEDKITYDELAPSLQNLINSKATKIELYAEIEDRIAGDTAEAQARIAGDTAEAQARINGDNALWAKITDLINTDTDIYSKIGTLNTTIVNYRDPCSGNCTGTCQTGCYTHCSGSCTTSCAGCGSQ